MKKLAIAFVLALALVGGTVALTGPSSTPAYACTNNNC